MPKILIVDDEPHIRLLLEQTLEELENEGVVLLTAENGREALETMKREKPALVFLDIMMPRMNGFDVCREIKKESGPTVVLLTAKGQEFDRQKGNEAGADLYMTKPFDPDEVLAKAREILNLPGNR